jgi:hypothetical protein
MNATEHYPILVSLYEWYGTFQHRCFPFTNTSRLTDLSLTNSTVQSHVWEVYSFSAGRVIPRFVWNPKVHYRLHKSTPLDANLNQVRPVHTVTFNFSKIHFNIILPSIPRSPKLSRLFKDFPTYTELNEMGMWSWMINTYWKGRLIEGALIKFVWINWGKPLETVRSAGNRPVFELHTGVYPKVPGLDAWSENCKWYSCLPLDAVVSLFCESA